MTSNVIFTLINTLILVMAIPLIGIAIDYLNKIILSFITNIFGIRIAYIFANRVTFIGTVHHELAHALFALITGAKIIKINLFKVQDDTLGSVKFITRGNTLLKSIQLTMSSIAPVILGIISEYLLITKVVSNINNTILLWIIYYIIISILLHMTMSTQDIKNALKGLPVCTVIIYIILYITKFSII